jgi:ribosomal protein S24E
MVYIKRRKYEKISKGYRLKPSTHKLIDKLQVMLNADQDTVVTRACKILYKELKNKIYTKR